MADSFEGLPPPDAGQYPADAGDQHHTFEPLAVSLEQVQANFAEYGLLDDQVTFLEGWFKDTLPTAPIERLAVLRLDGDMYESTMDALDALCTPRSRRAASSSSTTTPCPAAARRSTTSGARRGIDGPDDAHRFDGRLLAEGPVGMPGHNGGVTRDESGHTKQSFPFYGLQHVINVP